MNEILNRLFQWNVAPIPTLLNKMVEIGVKEPKIIENTKSYFVVSLINDGNECKYKFHLKESVGDKMLKVVSFIEKN